MQKYTSHAPLAITPASRVSQDTVHALSQAILKAFQKLASIDSNCENNPVDIAFKLINSFKYLPVSAAGADAFDTELENLDIFSPLLHAAVTSGNNSIIIWELITILFAYISIHRQFHPLILHNLNVWNEFIVDYNNEVSSTSQERDPIKFGVLSLLSIVQNFDEITPDLFEFFKLSLKPTLLEIWVPQWQNYNPSTTKLINGDEKISNWITKDYHMDFLITTFLSSSSSSLKVLPSHYFVYKISKRISHFPNLIDPKLYQLAIAVIMENGISDIDNSNSHSANYNDLPFYFQILMEVIDHPELNYLQENRLILLLDIALNHLMLVPTHCLHSSFGNLGSTQSLSSTLNIIQFLLSKFLINTGNITQLINKSNKKNVTNNNNNNNNNSRKKDWFQSQQTNYQIPFWFEDSILPPIPPISKSLFTFDKDLSHESDSIMIVRDLLRCLNLTILLNSKLLRDYNDLNINALTQPPDHSSNISNGNNHIMIEQYMQLYLIPLSTSLLLAQQLNDQEQEQENKQEEEEDKNLIGSSSVRHLSSQLIFFSSLKLCENLIIKEKNLALYHLIKFITKISLDDLVLQKISINLLNHLFFHQINDGSNHDNLIQRLCLKNQLSLQALKDYIILWNDGSQVYNSFFKNLFYEDQPEIETTRLTMSDLVGFFSDDEQIVISTPPTTMTSVTTNDRPVSLQPIPQKNNVEVFTPLSKYDAYSSNSFVPSSSNNANTSTNKQPQQPQQPQNTTPSSSNRYLYNKSALPQEHSSGNNDNSTQVSGSMNDSYSLDNSFSTTNTNMTRQPTTLTRATDAMTTAPTTPTSYKNSNCNNNNNLWIESPMANFKSCIINKNSNKNKMVNTGKNYILGGHNKVKNNSRAQSIHIDDFENSND
ncbi:hypothetical protein SUVZ_07G2080 [Saccharomyces uvarum]|uniref:Uncharacterized protein n=1 Tax=Saccharomyces uvarum TaxID=230603 RepID=A0ABN8WYS5_SACUV|nr:hypothetical protein SUVZ_07G2080 [Saccharomyces uvarum]